MSREEARGGEAFRNGPLVVLSSNTSWNVHNFRAGLVRALLDARYRVAVAAPADSYTDRLIKMGCEFYEVAMDPKGSSPLHDFRTLRRYQQLYAKLRPALALHYTIKPVNYGGLAAGLKGVPFISTITGLGTAFLHRSVTTWIARRLYRLTQRRAARVFFQNKDDLDLFVSERLVEREKAAVVPGAGVNLARFTPRPLPSARPGENPNAVTFLFVGRLMRDKGVMEFVEAAHQLRSRFPDSRFLLLGPTEVQNRTAISVSTVDGWVRKGSVEHLGAVEDVEPHIREADCVVLPSYREGVPRSLLEAAAMARPIITTDAVGCRRAVEDGVTGYLCRVRDAGDLALKMERVIRTSPEERSQMGLRGRQKTEREFDERLVVDRYMEVVADLLR